MNVWLRDTALTFAAWAAGAGPVAAAADRYRTLLVRFSPEALAGTPMPTRSAALRILGYGITDCSGGATVIATGMTGAGTLIITNVDPASIAYLGDAAVTNAAGIKPGLPIGPVTGSVSIEVQDIATWYGILAGVKLGWMFLTTG